MRISNLLLCLVLLITLAGCDFSDHFPSEPNNSIQPSQSTTVAVQTDYGAPQLPLTAISLPLVEETVYADDKTLLFTCSFQKINITLQDPDIAQTISMDLLDKIESLHSSAAMLQQEAESAYVGQPEWTPYRASILFTPERIDDVLSLTCEEVIFSGGSRYSAVSNAVTYDLTSGTSLKLDDILLSDYSADALCTLTLEALSEHPDKEQLYWDYKDTIRDHFNSNTLTTAWYLSNNGLCFYFSPYEIAPYVCGTVVAEIPYSSLAGILEDHYFPPEIANSTGIVSFTALDQTDLSKFSQFAEVISDDTADAYLLTTDGVLYNIQLDSGTLDNDGTFIAENRIYSSNTLSPGDCIIIQGNYHTLRLTYTTSDQSYSFLYNNLNS